MNRLNIFILLLVVCFFAACKPATIKENSFKVWGNCEMCKETIESALKTDGVKTAEWNVDSKIMKVSYDTTKISLDAIQQLVAGVGYDNDKYKGKDSAYAALPECCQYLRK